jgi:signal transduction histidine kinase
VIPTIFVSYYILVANRFYDLKIIKQSILKFFIFDLLIAIAYYLTFALASLAGKNVLSFDSFLYGQVLLVGLYIYYYRYLFEDRRTNLHEGFYRYTLARGSREDSLRIQYLLQVFRDNLQTKYNINSLYLTVILYERAKHYIVGKKVTQEPLYENRVFINNSSEHVLELIIYDKLDGFDLSIQDVENVEKDLNELLHLIFQSILYEESINFTDVLQQKINQATETLRVQKQELQEKYQFEKDMMGIMGHELRTPMTVAKGMTELVMNKIKANTLDNAYADEKLSKIYASIIKEADLIQTMLSTAHIDNKKVNLQISEVNLFDVVDYSVTAFHKDATDKGLYLNFAQSSQQIPLIVSDSGRVQEIINNLVSNAVKYTNKGGVTVEIELTKDFVIVHVTDTGIGIPKSELKNLGRKFYRIHQHLDEKKEVVRAGGTGLGLYVVKGLLNALGGELKVKSKEGVGSTFSAYFPLKTDYHDNVFITQKPVDEHDMFEKLGLKTNQ